MSAEVRWLAEAIPEGQGWASPSSGAEGMARCECGSPAGSERACGLCGRPQPSFPGWRLRPDRGELLQPKRPKPRSFAGAYLIVARKGTE
jgi:hypothetical protein